jgi:hypothetical protein
MEDMQVLLKSCITAGGQPERAIYGGADQESRAKAEKM